MQSVDTISLACSYMGGVSVTVLDQGEVIRDPRPQASSADDAPMVGPKQLARLHELALLVRRLDPADDDPHRMVDEQVDHDAPMYSLEIEYLDDVTLTLHDHKLRSARHGGWLDELYLAMRALLDGGQTDEVER